MQEFDFASPKTLDAACQLLAQTGGRVVAGGTDVIPRLQRHMFPATTLVDISRLDALRFITTEDNEIRIGALTTYAEMLESPLLQEEAPVLLEAARTVGCPQTRYRGTLGGNIANASPAGDTLPPLLVLNAEVKLVSAAGERVLPLSEVLLGPGQTAIRPDEVLHSVAFQRLEGPYGSAFFKLGKRKGMNIAVVSVAVLMRLVADGTIAGARVAFGSVAPTAVRSKHSEAVLNGERPTAEVFERAARAALADISPISDVRSTAAYRRHASMTLLRRALETAAARAGGIL